MSEKTFWDEIRENREKQGLTLESISANTKIRQSILENIEAGNFSELPETYIRLFLKAYARETGNDFKELLEHTTLPQDMESQKNYRLTELNKDGRVKSSVSNGPLAVERKKSRGGPLYIAVTVVILLFVIYIGKQVVDDSGSVEKLTITDTVNTIAETAGQDSIKDSSGTVMDVISSDGRADESLLMKTLKFPVSVHLFPISTMTYRLSGDGMKAREELLPGNSEHSFSVNSAFNLSISNAKGCQIRLNDILLPVTEQDRVKFSVNADGMIELDS